MYTPKPIDTQDVSLPAELLELTEKIAQNVHDVWATQKMEEGWRYGEVVDIEQKLTPLLVSYEDLSESDKDYDRNTAFSTLKMIVKLGYHIQKQD